MPAENLVEPNKNQVPPPMDNGGSNGHESDVYTHPLYPEVQNAMDALKTMAGEYQKSGQTLSHTESGEPILTPDIINSWAKELGISNGKRGTFHNDSTYAYLKPCNMVGKESDIDKTLATARHLTSLGAIHPESQWAAYKADGGGYQLLVVSPKLEPWLLDEDLSGRYDDRPERPMRDGSHITEWFKRIDPNFVAGQPIPQDSPLLHLNQTEASNRDNWGWDKTGALYPVDVEVLHPGKPVLLEYVSPKPNVHFLDTDVWL